MSEIKSIQSVQNITNKDKTFINRYPLLAPVANTVIAAAVGAAFGALMPIGEDVFIHHAKMIEASKIMENTTKLAKTDKDVAGQEFAKIRKILGSEMFEKIGTMKEFANEKIQAAGKALTELEVDESLKKIEKLFADEYKKFMKKDASTREKYKPFVSKMRYTNIKTLATIFGASALIITGTYSYLQSKKKSRFI